MDRLKNKYIPEAKRLRNVLRIEVKMVGLEEIIRYEFKDTELLKEALTHSSYFSNKNGKSNEKLEFVGDAVLQMIITEYLYRAMPLKTEGELTRIRATIVCERSLYETSLKWDLGKFILMSKGEELTGGRQRQALLADAVEALIAAIYLDGGYEVAKDFVLENLSEIIIKAQEDEIVLDNKTKLQELLQENGVVEIKYEVTNMEGPAHRRKFYSKVSIDDITMGRGEGMTRKESEQNAAKDALSKLVTERVDI